MLEFVNSLLDSKNNIIDQLKLLKENKDNKEVEKYIKYIMEDNISPYLKYFINKYYFGLDVEEVKPSGKYKNAKLYKICFLDEEKMNENNVYTDDYMQNNISIIGTRPANGKMEYMSKIICGLLDDNKNVFLIGLGGKTNYYEQYLLNEITKININVLKSYLNPCSRLKKETLDINKEKYIKGLEYLLNHDLVIEDFHSINDYIIDGANTLLKKIIYMINMIKSDVVIIDNIENIDENIQKTLKTLNNVSNKTSTKFVVFTNLKKEYEENFRKELLSFENSKVLDKYADDIIILEKGKIYIIKNN